MCFPSPLNNNINGSCKVLVPCFMSRNKRSQTFSIRTKSLFLSNFVHKFVYIPVSEHFSFAKIIHPLDSCGISRSWLNSMIITQVHLVLGTMKGHTTQCHRYLKFWRSAIGMLTARMSTRAVARELNVNFSTISRIHPAPQPQTMSKALCGRVVCWC
jgi:hypothetical protein